MDKVKQLRKHKALATGLFVLMAMVYVLILYLIKQGESAWMYYVKAFSEAAMVGALADWFAVTALFKHPLGLKIPHTNLIESNQQQIGANLGGFVTENFLTNENLRPYIEQLEISDWIVKWAEKPNAMSLLSKELSGVISDALSHLDMQALVGFSKKEIQGHLHLLPVNTMTSDIIDYVLENGEHHRILNMLLPEIRDYIINNERDIYERVISKQPVLSLVGGKMVTRQLVDGFLSFIDEVEGDQNHPLRNTLAHKLLDFRAGLEGDAGWHNKVVYAIGQYLGQEKTDDVIASILSYIKIELEEDLADEHSKIRNYIALQGQKFIENFKQNKKQQHQLNRFVQVSLYKMVLRHKHALTDLIEQTVNAWDGVELSEKLELEVGKDLQYIRINGTLVGGLVGLVIYILTVLFSA